MQLLYGRSKNETRTRTKRADADEDRNLPDRDGRTRHIWIFSNPREIKSTLNSIKDYGDHNNEI